MSWTESERERKQDPGGCLPPAAPPLKLPKYVIDAGTACLVCKIMQQQWRPHVTSVDLGFERHEGYQDSHYLFRHAGYFIRVYRKYVHHRDDLSQ